MIRSWSRLGIFGIALIATLLLAACGGDADPTATQGQGSPTPTQAQSDATPTTQSTGGDYFEGKTIRVIIPYSPGGSSSVLVPYFAHQIPNYIPGNPRMISTHITPIIAGYNYLAKAPNDGTEIMYTSNAPISQQYTEESDFDVAAFSYINGYTSGENVLFGNGTLPFEDLTGAAASGHQLRVPVETDPTEMSGADIGLILAAEAMGFDLKLIPLSAASTGTAESLVAMERGDVDAQIASAIWYTMPSLRPGWTADGTVKPLAYFGSPGQEMKPNSEADVTAPNLTDLVLEQANAEIKNLYNALVVPEVALGKHFLAPPDTNPEALEILRQAFTDAMNDPTFVSGLERLLGQTSINMSGADLQELMGEAVAAFADGRETRDQKVLDLYNKYVGN
jgi:tripartite-type tricarboxylate transporter receptor subunit TctC